MVVSATQAATKLLRSPPLIALAAALVAAPAMWLYARSSASGMEGSAEGPVTQLPPAPPPMTLRPLAPAAALEINRQIAFSDAPNPPARPFAFRGGADTYERALTCLTAAVYYEAASESEDGQRAVAQVVLNRVRHPAFPASVCAVVYQGSTLPTGCQFTFTCDGSLARARSTREWARAEAVAAAALAGSVFPAVGHALNYHANFVVPYWATSLAKKAVVGTHIFYRLPGFWGEPRAFGRPYAAVEADPFTLRATALAAHHRSGASRAASPKPQVEASVDPRVELVGIVAMLASRSAAAESDVPLMKTARAEFSRFSNHVAVEIYRQLAAEDDLLASRVLTQVAEQPAQPAEAALEFPNFDLPGRSKQTGAGLAEALEAFSTDAKFAAFFAKHQLLYRSLRDAQLARMAPVVAKVESYTGLSAGKVRLVVAPLADSSFVANCFFAKPADAQPLVLFAAGTAPRSPSNSPDSETTSLLANSLALKAVAAPWCRLPVKADCKDKDSRARIVAHEIAEALAVRAVQSGGTRAQRGKTKASQLDAAINEALTSYEQNRTWFPTFTDFHPVLLDTLASSERRARVPTQEVAARLKLPASMRMGPAASDPVCHALKQRQRA